MKVWGEVPNRWDGKIRKAMEIEGWDTISAYIRELIKKDLVSKGLLGNGGRNGQVEEKEVEEATA
ncbi:hypothetical protein DRP05_12075 [Archaeoglobales archaeon]|nr:MAG: hypothetical protein DRP05_12075 [Archaeoglobales archaeon]